MTCFEVLEDMLRNTKPSVARKLRSHLHFSCESYNCALSCKNKRTASLMLKLLNRDTIAKIKELCSYEPSLMTHALCVNSANYHKYIQSLNCFWYKNKNGLDIWSIPEPGEIMKTKIALTTPSGQELKVGAKVKLLKFTHSNGNNNVLEAFVESKNGEQFKCSCRHIRRIQVQ